MDLKRYDSTNVVLVLVVVIKIFDSLKLSQ